MCTQLLMHAKCDCTWELYRHHKTKRVALEVDWEKIPAREWRWKLTGKKSLPHQGLILVSVLRLPFQSGALPIELFPTFCNSDSIVLCAL